MNKIKDIVGKNLPTKEFKKRVSLIVKDELDKIYETGESIESLTYEILDEVKKNCDKTNLNSYIVAALEAILETLDNYAHYKVLNEHKKIIRAKYKIRNLLNMQEVRLKAAFDAIESFLKDNNLHSLQYEVNEIKDKLLHKVYRILDKFKYNKQHF